MAVAVDVEDGDEVRGAGEEGLRVVRGEEEGVRGGVFFRRGGDEGLEGGMDLGGFGKKVGVYKMYVLKTWSALEVRIEVPSGDLKYSHQLTSQWVAGGGKACHWALLKYGCGCFPSLPLLWDGGGVERVA
ncbi:MAG: hypothetical protein L6R35_003015 [Caloplaca aegaea]|nr:MAG: hypothetical protein L6R35_003015 [Caloplaca aegaea]